MMFAKLHFRNLLTYCSTLGFTRRQVERINEEFRESLLNYASATPDNLASVEKIEIGRVKVNGEMVSGLKIKGKAILLSEVMYAIEEMALPSQIKEQFPNLSVQEWEAATRVIFLVVQSLEETKKG